MKQQPEQQDKRQTITQGLEKKPEGSYEIHMLSNTHDITSVWLAALTQSCYVRFEVSHACTHTSELSFPDLIW